MGKKILSVNVGKPQEVIYKGKPVLTGIFKTPIRGAVQLNRLNLEGDVQADLQAHGGVNKAVYFYPFEHYDYWRKTLPEVELTPGIFGENFTVERMLETEVRIGDHYRIGEAIIRITQPRIPCYKLNVRFNRPDMVQRFLKSQRLGFYAAVIREGRVEAGEEIILLQQAAHGITVNDFIRWYTIHKSDVKGMQKALSFDDLPDFWRKYFQAQIAKQGS